MPTLFEIADDMDALQDLIEQEEQSPEEADALEVWLTVTDGEAKDKVDRYAAVIRAIEARAEVRKAEAKALADRARFDENAARRMKDALAGFFERFEIKSMETTHYRVTLAGNGGKAPMQLDDVTPEDVPEMYCRTIPARVEVDKETIRQALDSGQELPFARLLPRGKSIRIK